MLIVTDCSTDSTSESQLKLISVLIALWGTPFDQAHSDRHHCTDKISHLKSYNISFQSSRTLVLIFASPHFCSYLFLDFRIFLFMKQLQCSSVSSPLSIIHVCIHPGVCANVLLRGNGGRLVVFHFPCL